MRVGERDALVLVDEVVVVAVNAALASHTARSDGGAFMNTFVGTPRMSTVSISNMPPDVSTAET